MEIRDNRPGGESPMPATTLNEARIESAKIMEAGRRIGGERTTYIENSPEKSVVLSPRLEQLIRDVGGCQSEQVAAVIRRVMWELLTR